MLVQSSFYQGCKKKLEKECINIQITDYLEHPNPLADKHV
uniref:Uncharacterized protein n=1 Tax=Anguilla anguilla TaxID=7936 RepID=A0A0E9PSL0_ANGAN